eukprot:3755129-Rhodomonas_salina.1
MLLISQRVLHRGINCNSARPWYIVHGNCAVLDLISPWHVQALEMILDQKLHPVLVCCTSGCFNPLPQMFQLPEIFPLFPSGISTLCPKFPTRNPNPVPDFAGEPQIFQPSAQIRPGLLKSARHLGARDPTDSAASGLSTARAGTRSVGP